MLCSHSVTLYELISYYDSLESLEGMISSGMEEGAVETLDRLEKLIAREK